MNWHRLFPTPMVGALATKKAVMKRTSQCDPAPVPVFGCRPRQSCSYDWQEAQKSC